MIKTKRGCKIWPAIDTCSCKKKNGIRTYLQKTSKNKKIYRKQYRKNISEEDKKKKRKKDRKEKRIRE